MACFTSILYRHQWTNSTKFGSKCRLIAYTSSQHFLSTILIFVILIYPAPKCLTNLSLQKTKSHTNVTSRAFVTSRRWRKRDYDATHNFVFSKCLWGLLVVPVQSFVLCKLSILEFCTWTVLFCSTHYQHCWELSNILSSAISIETWKHFITTLKALLKLKFFLKF